MVRRRLRIDAGTDPAALAGDLESWLAARRLPPGAAAALADEVRRAAEKLVEHGSKVAAVGGRFRASRTVELAGYRIELACAIGVRRSWLAGLFGRAGA